MTLIEILRNLIKKYLKIPSVPGFNKLRLPNINPIIFLSAIATISLLFFTINVFVERKNNDERNNLYNVTSSNEFYNLTNYFFSKISSPYEEVEYSIKNNDTLDKILKKFKVRNEDIAIITSKLRQKQLSNIYTGRKISLITKKLQTNDNTVISLKFPINKTTSVEVRKFKENFIIKENILKLYKKEVVVKNTITTSLYNSAIEVNIEPNIIVEFARIFVLK